jgi:hypothetical protein
MHTRILIGSSLLLAACLLATRPAFGAGEANLGWNDCVSGGGLAADAIDCTSNSGLLSLVVSFRPAAQLDSMVAVSGAIILITDQSPMPPWWHYETGGCRSTSMSISFDFTSGFSGCYDLWFGQAQGGYQYSPGYPFGPNVAQLKFIAGVPNPTRLVASPQTEYSAAIIRINRLKSTGTGSCAGCDAQVCLYLPSLRLSEPPPSQDQILQDTGTHEFVTLNYVNGGAPACPGAVPTRRATWGAVKALYR